MDDEVFRALGDPTRRRLLDMLNHRNGQTLSELCAGLDIARQSVSKHLAVLEGANLVTTVRRGREKLHHLNAEPINAIADRWINQYDRRRVQFLADLKTTLETTTVSDNDFVYTSYIKTTPEKLWQALTDQKFTQQYWGLSFDTDWKVGSPMDWKQGDVTMSGPGQQVSRVRPVPATRVQLAPHHPRVRQGRRPDRRAAGQDQRRTVVPRNLRTRASRRPGQAHRHPQRLRAQQRDPGDGLRRLAPADLRPQVPGRIHPRTRGSLTVSGPPPGTSPASAASNNSTLFSRDR